MRNPGYGGRNHGCDEGMYAMTEPQTWTMIGAVVAIMIGTITVILRTANMQFATTREQSKSLGHELRADITSVQSSLSADIGNLRTQITHLDRDVQATSKRIFPTDPV